MTDLAKQQQAKIIDIPNQIRCGMSMDDQELNDLRQLALKLLHDL